MEKAQGKRKMEDEDKGVQKQPRLGSDEEMSSRKVAVSPPMRQDDSLGRYVYKIGENLTERYKIQSKLGEGSSGQVLECWDREGRESVAIKVSRSTRHPNVVMYERYMLRHLAKRPESIPRCVQIRDSFEYGKHECIVFEKLGPSLRKFLQMRNCSPVPVDLVWQFGRRILEAVAFLHDEKIIHADLKPENILLASRDSAELLDRERSSSDEVQWYWPQSSAIKVIDFGSSIFDPNRIEYELYKNIVCTRSYRAPEIILGLGWSYPCDLWSVGCILVELYTGQRLFNTDSDLEHLAMMQRHLGQLPEHMTQSATRATEFCLSGVSSGAVNKIGRLNDLVSRHVQSSELIHLLHGLLKYEPKDRLTARQAIEHPFFTKNIRWDIDQEGNLTVTHPKGK